MMGRWIASFVVLVDNSPSSFLKGVKVD